MAHQSAYTAEEITEMMNSGDIEQQTVAARNLWAFWEGWKESLQVPGDKEVREHFSGLAPVIHQLLVRELKETTVEEGEMPRQLWHFLLSLGCLQFEPALDTIQELLLDNSVTENVRAFAADALTRYPPSAIPESLEELLWKLSETDDSLPVRVNSIRAIAAKYSATGEGEIAQRFWEMAKVDDLHNAVISTIIAAIGEVGALSIVPDLVHMMITRRTAAAKKDAAMALDRIAELHGMANRNELIKSIKDVEMLDLE